MIRGPSGVLGRPLGRSAFYFEAVVEKGGRAYVFAVYNPETRPVLESILATVKLTPAAAKN